MANVDIHTLVHATAEQMNLLASHLEAKAASLRKEAIDLVQPDQRSGTAMAQQAVTP